MPDRKILFACIPTPGNRYMIDLKEGLEQEGCEVIWDYKAFWECEEDFDVIHIHWPEYLSFKLESFIYKDENLGTELWQELEQCLIYWSKKARIIWTRHNTLPHNRQDIEFQHLYKLIATYTKTVVHFAQYSKREFISMYPEIKHPNHCIISHQNYTSIPNAVTKEQARDWLNISQKVPVMLVFGGVRKNEFKVILKAFSYLEGKGKILLAPHWKSRYSVKKPNKLNHFIQFIENHFNPNRITNKGYVPDEDVQYYLKAADFIFIPRTKELTSGIVFLAFSFGLAVVGPNIKNIGEILSDTGNFTYNLNDEYSLQQAIHKVSISDETNIVAEKNFVYANEIISVKNISLKYMEAYGIN